MKNLFLVACTLFLATACSSGSNNNSGNIPQPPIKSPGNDKANLGSCYDGTSPSSIEGRWGVNAQDEQGQPVTIYLNVTTHQTELSLTCIKNGMQVSGQATSASSFDAVSLRTQSPLNETVCGFYLPATTVLYSFQGSCLMLSLPGAEAPLPMAPVK